MKAVLAGPGELTRPEKPVPLPGRRQAAATGIVAKIGSTSPFSGLDIGSLPAPAGSLLGILGVGGRGE